MKKLSPTELPEEYHYYRSHARSYANYLVHSQGSWTVLVDEVEWFGYITHYCFLLFSYAVFEKSDIEPTRELLQKYGMKRGLVLWSGWHRDRPIGSWWLRLGYVISRSFHHSTRSAFSVLDVQEYWKKWQSNMRGHRSKIHKLLQSGKISINTNASWEEFHLAYEKTKLPHGYKRYLIYRQNFLMNKHPEDFRIFLASVDGEVLAGAIFLDDCPTSTYLIAFQNNEAKRYHLGLALIDRWFADSYTLGYRYLDFDHMKDIFDSSGYAGYTQFKGEIADYDVRFWRVFMKLLF